jgi:hypothetical protein
MGKLLLLVVLGVGAALLSKELPGLKRYQKIAGM